MKEGKAFYTPTKGNPELLEAIAEKIEGRRFNGRQRGFTVSA